MGLVTTSVQPSKDPLQRFGTIGLRDALRTMHLSRLFFSVQVSFPVHCLKSDDLALLVVPSPKALKCMLFECFLVCKLLLCGDVETNPSPNPTTPDMFKTIMEGQNSIQKDISFLRTDQSKLEKAVGDLLEKMAEVDRVLFKLETQSRQVESLQATVTSLQDTIKMQGAKLADLDDRSRRSNLAIFGTPDCSNETEAELRTKVLKELLFIGKMNVRCTSVARIHRLGRKRANRPIIFFFQDYNEKAGVFRNAKRLKGTKVFIQNDCCQKHTVHP